MSNDRFTPFTLLDGERAVRTEAALNGGRVYLSPEALRDSLGWELKPEGLCRGSLCVRVPDRTRLVGPSGIDLETLTDRIDRPLALDLNARVGFLGASASTRARELATLEAPDFTLPDLSGQLHSLANYRGKKVLLIAHASW
jgi:hypothetical protein